jgi:(p)ppGpp synthase/HD superfamily hydrolase
MSQTAGEEAMIYTDMTKKAMKLAYDAHLGKTDKYGIPYIYHPAHVAEQMRTEEETTAALLHDVVEDTGVTLEQLAGAGFPPAVVEAVRLLTHEDGTDYMDYVARLKPDSIAKAVKLADLAHNSDTSRIGGGLTEEDRQRLEKYGRAKRCWNRLRIL